MNSPFLGSKLGERKSVIAAFIGRDARPPKPRPRDRSFHTLDPLGIIQRRNSSYGKAGDFRARQYDVPTHRENRDEWEAVQFTWSTAVLREVPLLAATQVSPTPDRRLILA
jgi:hypothetical protein